uniref:Docking protein 2-like n=1 Tax=Acanthochromis polyacanthus TaxID=80966 RepID=A0A3Q1GGZ1_9TELE
NMDVIFKEGILYLQVVKFGIKSWRKMRTVLFKASSTGVGRLELCCVADSSSVGDQKKAWQKTERKVVRLSDCFSVTAAPKESCPAGCSAFYLNTTQGTYTLASTTSRDWLSAICLLAFQVPDTSLSLLSGGNGLTMEDNDLYSSWKSGNYKVTVQSTEASKRCRLAGEYVVYPDKEAVILLDVSAGRTVYCWPYRLLRKFGQVEVKGGFSIEAGRRCDSGEGVFTFLTQYGPQIFQLISQQCAMPAAETQSGSLLTGTSFSSGMPPASAAASLLENARIEFEEIHVLELMCAKLRCCSREKSSGYSGQLESSAFAAITVVACGRVARLVKVAQEDFSSLEWFAMRQEFIQPPLSHLVSLPAALTGLQPQEAAANRTVPSDPVKQLDKAPLFFLLLLCIVTQSRPCCYPRIERRPKY